jgi:hypothetical protein
MAGKETVVRILSLNGRWEWYLPQGPRIPRMVPSSYPCVGEATFERSFDLDLAASERAFLCFEGVQYLGHVELNGRDFGDMLPYVRYRFEITDCARRTGNTLSVRVKDITADFGPTGGWEDYGGIGRDVGIEVHDKVFIEDFQWLTILSRGAATGNLTIWVAGSDDAGTTAAVTATLARGGALLCTATDTVRLDDASPCVRLTLPVVHPELWSPDSPALYDLDISLVSGPFRDRLQRRVGIREIRAEGPRFLLNGKELFLKGVARHEMWGDDTGFSLTEAQIEEDLLLVKKMGANFVRLVHYPHDARTISAADRIGLMVSEEPGLWWSDLGDERITAAALEIMRRTVLRDRNNPSVIAWLFFNECRLDDADEYLSKGAELCRSLDPSRMISGANCMDSKSAKPVFDRYGFDFYTQHPYAYEPSAMVHAMEVLHGKPLVFTEWGGWYIHNNPNLLSWFWITIVRGAHARTPGRCLAGICWWQWQDIYQFSRGLPGCQDGVLSDGLVDRYRHRKPMYAEMARLFEEIDHPHPREIRVVHVEHRGAPGDRGRLLRVIDLSVAKESDAARAAWQSALEHPRIHPRTPVREGIPCLGPILPAGIAAPAGLDIVLEPGAPIMLSGDFPRIDLPIGCATSALHLFGHTTYFDGFPVRGTPGQTIARYVLTYEDGTSTEIPLRNGIEIASASMIARASRMNPVAVAAPRVLVLEVDPDWEIYQVNYFLLAADPARRLELLRFESLNAEFCPLLYGVAVSV